MKTKQIKGLISKITKNDFCLNTSFYYYGHKIDCQSGANDFVAVTIDNNFSFSFDFWTKRLVFGSENEALMASAFDAFCRIYNGRFQSVKTIYANN
jgi:hypothetical protein